MHVITLAVDDLQRALTFYRDGLGLPTKGVVADEYEGSDTEAAGAIVIFKLAGGLILSLYPRTELAKDARIPPSPPASGEHAFRQARQPLASSALDTSSEIGLRSTLYSRRLKKPAQP